MIDDDAEYEARRQIRAQADADVASFISSLDQDETTGVPPPPIIKVSEVASDPIELEFVGFGGQEAETQPAAGTTPAPSCSPCPPPWICPDECPLPEGTCQHYVSFQVKFTQCEIDCGYIELLDIGHSDLIGGHVIGLWNNGLNWRFAGGVAGDNIDLTISNTDVPLVACQCYNVLIGFDDPGDPDSLSMFFCVNGVSTSRADIPRSAAIVCEVLPYIFVGDAYPSCNVVNRKYRHVTVSPPGFNSDTDSYDSLVNASVITEGGVNVLLVNSGADIGYGEKDISWTIACGGCP